MSKVADLICRLKTYPPESYVACVIWEADDVLGYAKNDMGGKIVTVDQAEDLLDQMERKHDASLGISWDTIRCYIDEYL